MVGIYPVPDEMDIIWSSGEYTPDQRYNEVFTDYTILDGWAFSGDDLIDRNGIRNQNYLNFFKPIWEHLYRI